METNAKIVPVFAFPSTASQPTAPEEPSPTQSSFAFADSYRYRLLIEEGPSKGSFIYKTLDSVTGEIIHQYPREQLLRLAEADSYDAGAVINTSA